MDPSAFQVGFIVVATASLLFICWLIKNVQLEYLKKLTSISIYDRRQCCARLGFVPVTKICPSEFNGI
jgi:hypothetical protein